MLQNLRNPRVLLLHGWGGKKENHWLTWIESELHTRNIVTFFPKIPNNYNPNLTKWLTHIDHYINDFKPTIVIAHSLGAVAWWHYQTNNAYPLEKLISVAPPTFASFPAKMSTFFPLPKPLFREKSHTTIYALDDRNIDASTLQDIAMLNKITLYTKDRGEHLDHFSKTSTLEELLKVLNFS